MKAIKLGVKVKDPVTTFEGIVVERSMFRSKCIHVAVATNQLSDGMPQKPIALDQRKLVAANDGENIYEEVEPNYLLDKWVKNLITGQEGRVCVIGEFLHSASMLWAKPYGTNKDGNAFEEFGGHENEFIVKSAPKEAQLPHEKEETVVKHIPVPSTSKSGGPIERARSFGSRG